jgi:uncharacterized membrane protein YgcG
MGADLAWPAGMRVLIPSLLSLLAVATPAVALIPEPLEVRQLVQMPLAVTEVIAVGVPAPRVEAVVVELNRAEVPIFDAVEIVRYVPFELALQNYVPASVNVTGLPWELSDLDMPLLLRFHLDAGLRGERLAWAVRNDLERIGFAVAADDRWQPAPLPRETHFVYYLEPGYRFETQRGYFPRVVTVDRELPGRQRWAFDARAVGPQGEPPGHRKHGPGGVDPTPGHVRHHVAGGPPGHNRGPRESAAGGRGRRGGDHPGRGNGRGNGGKQGGGNGRGGGL